MNIISNEKLIRRNNRIGLVATFGGLIILGLGMYITLAVQQYASFSLLFLLVGYILSQVGIYYSNRFGKSPRPDEMLNTSLKGLDSKYTVYHYSSPVSHLLVGPAGIWILLPHHQKGVITYSNGRWKQKGGNWYLKIFAQEGLGRPEVEVSSQIQSMQKFLKEKLGEENEIPQIQSALVFTNPKVEISIPDDETPPAETIQLSKLKDVVRKSSKGKSLSPANLALIEQALEK